MKRNLIKNKFLLILAIVLLSCNDKKDRLQEDIIQSNLNYYKSEYKIGNLYLLGIDTLDIKRKDEILFKYFGLIWKENIYPNRDSISKCFLDSLILQKLHKTSNRIMIEVKKISDSLSLTLAANQCLNGDYFFCDSMPRLIYSKDSLTSRFSLIVDSFEDSRFSILNVSIDSSGMLSKAVFIKKVNKYLDSIAYQKILGAKLWSPAWYNNHKVSFCMKNIHFTYMGTVPNDTSK